MKRMVLVAVAVLLTSGCSASAWQEVGMGVGDFTTTWTVGSCHRLDQPEEVDPVFPSDTSPPVPCDSPHESETFANVPLTGAVAKQPQRPSPLWLARALNGACGWSAMTAYLGGGPLDALRNVSILQILPSEPEWERGVRRIRCDVLIWPRTSETVASVSRPLHSILTTSAGDQFRVCRADGQEVGCDQPHDAELINTWIRFTYPQIAKTPRTREAAEALAFCKPHADQYLGVPLSARPDLALYVGLPQDPPNPGKQVGQCWLGAAAKGLVWTGSLRAGVGRLS
jgi:hypothetical protein